MNSDQIKTFISLANTRNFSRTAEDLIIAQSTVSKRISDLETEFGCPLFTRGPGGVSLTSAGRIFFAYAQQFSNIEEKAHMEIQYTELYGTYVALGTTYDYYDTYLCQKLHLISQNYPDIAFRIRFGQTGALLQDLKRAVIDVAFTHHPLYHMDYICEKIGEDDIVVVTDSKNTEYKSGVCASKIREMPFIDTNFLYAETRNKLFSPLQEYQIRVDIASAAIPLLKGNKWYAILPRRQVKSELSSGNLIEIKVLDAPLPPVYNYIVFGKAIENRQRIYEVLESCFLFS